MSCHTNVKLLQRLFYQVFENRTHSHLTSFVSKSGLFLFRAASAITAILLQFVEARRGVCALDCANVEPDENCRSRMIPSVPRAVPCE